MRGQLTMSLASFAVWSPVTVARNSGDTMGDAAATQPRGILVEHFSPDLQGDEHTSASDDRRPTTVAGYDLGSATYVAAWDAHAARIPAAARRSPLRLVREVAQTAVLALVLFVGTRSVVQGREVHGPSMQPTYHTGQRVFVTRYFFHSPRRGDVIVFHPPAVSRDDFIKRVIGSPGDHVVVKDGRVWVNGALLEEPYLPAAQTTCFGRWCDVTLGADEYFVMGDNRANSSDSRSWGPVQRDRIVGKTWLLYYPFSDFGFAP